MVRNKRHDGKDQMDAPAFFDVNNDAALVNLKWINNNYLTDMLNIDEFSWELTV